MTTEWWKFQPKWDEIDGHTQPHEHKKNSEIKTFPFFRSQNEKLPIHCKTWLFSLISVLLWIFATKQRECIRVRRLFSGLAHVNPFGPAHVSFYYGFLRDAHAGLDGSCDNICWSRIEFQQFTNQLHLLLTLNLPFQTNFDDSMTSLSSETV